MSSVICNPTEKHETLPSCFNIHAWNLFIYAESMRNIQFWFATEEKKKWPFLWKCKYIYHWRAGPKSIVHRNEDRYMKRMRKRGHTHTRKKKKKEEKDSCCITIHNLSTSLILLPYSQTYSFYQHYRENMKHFFPGSNFD